MKEKHDFSEVSAKVKIMGKTVTLQYATDGKETYDEARKTIGVALANVWIKKVSIKHKTYKAKVTVDKQS